MPRQVNVYEAKTQLSKLLEQVEAGAEFVIARNGRPVALLRPLPQALGLRTPGSLRGRIWTAPDFDEPDEELIGLMTNGAVFPSGPDG